MDVKALEQLLQAVREGNLSVEEALQQLRALPYENLEFARIDTHRALRTGFPEVVFCQGKTPEQVLAILERLGNRHRKVLATRASPELHRW